MQGKFSLSREVNAVFIFYLAVISDLLADDLPLGQDDTDKDDLTILNEILNAPSTGGDDFSKEWQAVFGTMPLSAGTTYTPGETDQAEFMPSNLLDLNKQMSVMSLSQSSTGKYLYDNPCFIAD